MEEAYYSSHSQVKVVRSFEEWWKTQLVGTLNAICWERPLVGNYQEIVDQVERQEGVQTLDMEWLKVQKLSPAGEVARQQILEDYARLLELGANPQVDVIFQAYEDEVSPVFPTHVHSWHVDRAPIVTETYLCTYLGESSQAVANDEAVQKIHNPVLRSALKEFSGAESEEELEVFLSDHCYDLHYDLLPHANPLDFGLGNLWRVSVLAPDSNVLPCIHRAPHTRLGDQARLLLIG